MKLQAGHFDQVYVRLWLKPMVAFRGHSFGVSSYAEVNRRADGSYYEVGHRTVFRVGAREVPLGSWHKTGLS